MWGKENQQGAGGDEDEDYDHEKCKCWSLSPVRLFVTPRTWARQASLSIEFSRQEHQSR